MKSTLPTYKVIGLMSGTSLDGLDMVAVIFTCQQESWSYTIQHVRTLPYSAAWKERLGYADRLSARALIQLHQEYGHWLGKKVQEFIQNSGFLPELIASHGHTVFHDPEKGITFQLGDGNAIAAATGITTVWDFRSLDVAMGGQGAPLVPVGDALLFSDYDCCINLGGFANLSFEKEGKRIACDPCPANLAMQYIMKPLGKAYDHNGEMGSKGKINPSLLGTLNQLAYYQDPPPKSLGKEWMEANLYPVLDSYKIPPEDKLRTIYEHIALKITEILPGGKGKKALLTGGGAKNLFLVERIRRHAPLTIVVPEETIIDYKEALIFALLGLLKRNNQINCYASVTGAKEDLSTGCIVTFNH